MIGSQDVTCEQAPRWENHARKKKRREEKNQATELRRRLILVICNGYSF